MKNVLKVFIFSFLLFVLISCGKTFKESKNEPKQNTEYVDLGLPSGTLWKTDVKEYYYIWYKWNDVMFEFGDNLPTREQFTELLTFCTWEWTGTGCKVTGNNGSYIIFPARGYCNCDGDPRSMLSVGGYWSRTEDGSEKAYFLFFNSEQLQIRNNLRCYGLSVCLVKD